MPYTLELKEAIWYINGKRVAFPRDGDYHPWAAPLSVIDDNGDIVPAKVDPATGGIVVSTAGIEIADVTVINTPENPVPVTIVEGPGGVDESVLFKGKASGVPDNAQTTILTYTNAAKILWLDGFTAHGDLDAEFLLCINTSEKLSYRTSEQNRTAQQIFPVAVRIAIGDIVEIKVIHFYNNPAKIGEFKATIFGHKF